jgi:hypothetical protein
MPSLALEYAPPTPRWRRRPGLWLFVAVIVSLILAQQTLWPMAKSWERRRQRSLGDKQWYANVRHYTAPPTKLKYSEDPADIPAGGSSGEYYPLSANYDQRQAYIVFGGPPADATVVHFTGWSPVASVPFRANLFIHERTTRSGVTRLIVLPGARFEDGNLVVGWQQIGMRDGLCTELNGDDVKLDFSSICGPGEIRIFAGQPDRNDPSRFSIPFQARGRSGWIDGEFVTQSPPVYPGEAPDPEWGYVVKLSVRRK